MPKELCIFNSPYWCSHSSYSERFLPKFLFYRNTEMQYSYATATNCLWCRLCVLQCHVPDCGKTFSTVYNLRTHIKLHDRLCSEVCQVSGCEAKFSTRRRLDSHMKEQHPANKSYRCHNQSSITVILLCAVGIFGDRNSN